MQPSCDREAEPAQLWSQVVRKRNGKGKEKGKGMGKEKGKESESSGKATELTQGLNCGANHIPLATRVCSYRKY